VIIALAGALAATVATAAIPLVQRQIIDNVIVTQRASIWPLAGLLVVAAAVNFYGIYLRRYRGGRLSLDVQHELRTDLFDSLPGWTARARTRCAPGSWSGGPFPT
jgi:ATP-binding cassette subfamily B protein